MPIPGVTRQPLLPLLALACLTSLAAADSTADLFGCLEAGANAKAGQYRTSLSWVDPWWVAVQRGAVARWGTDQADHAFSAFAEQCPPVRARRQERAESQRYSYGVSAAAAAGQFYNIFVSPPRPLQAFTTTQTNDDCAARSTYNLEREVSHTNFFVWRWVACLGSLRIA